MIVTRNNRGGALLRLIMLILTVVPLTHLCATSNPPANPARKAISLRKKTVPKSRQHKKASRREAARLAVNSEDYTLASEEKMLVAETQLRNQLQGVEIEPELPVPATEVTTHEQSATPRRFHYQVALSLRGIYDDNINLSQTNREGDFYTLIEPSINLGFGDPENNYVELDYMPQAFLFAQHTEDDALQHLITLNAQYRFPQVTFSLTQQVQILDGTGLTSATGTGTDFTRTNLDVSGRTRLNIYSTRVDANYSLTGKTFLTASLSYDVDDYQSLLSSTVVSANAYFNYTYSPKLAIGIGLTGGYDGVDEPSQDQLFEQINVRASYELTGKVSANLSAGVEFRQVTSGGESQGGGGSPVFDGSLFYQPFDGTSLALSLTRRTLNSAVLAEQDYHSTSFILSARQRFFQRIYLGLSVGYENSSYFSTQTDIASNRTDDYYFLQASVDLNITSYWTLGLFYFYRQDDSSLEAFSFYDNQFGLRTALTF